MERSSKARKMRNLVYEVRPSGVRFLDKEAAIDAARLNSTTGCETSVEDVATHEVVARYKDGKRV